MNNIKASVKTHNNMTKNHKKLNTITKKVNQNIQLLKISLNQEMNALRIMGSSVRKLEKAVNQIKNAFKLFTNNISLSQKRLNSFSTNKAIRQLGKLYKKAKSIIKLLNTMSSIKAPRLRTGSPDSMSTAQNSGNRRARPLQSMPRSSTMRTLEPRRALRGRSRTQMGTPASRRPLNMGRSMASMSTPVPRRPLRMGRSRTQMRAPQSGPPQSMPSDGGKGLNIGKDMVNIGKNIGNVFKSGFGIAAKSVGIVKNALNAIAPDRMAKLADMWKNAFGSMAASLAEKLGPAFDKLEQFMMSPIFQTFMNNLEGAISCLIPVFEYIVGLAEPLLSIVNQVFSFIIENSGTIAAVLMGIAGAIALITLVMAIYNGILLVHSTITSIAAGQNALLNAIMAMNPAVRIISAIIILIMILITLIATVKPVREAFAKLAEGFISFIENGINLFLEALAGLAKGIINFAGGAINAFLDVFVNPFIRGINTILDAIEMVTGKNFDRLQELSVDFSDEAQYISETILSKKVNLEGAKKAVGEGIRNFDANKIKSKIKGAFVAGAEQAGNKLQKQNFPTPPALAAAPQSSNDVTMEDQDMQLLREVAERESLKSYTTMTPSVKIDVGSINENADAEKIIQEIVARIVQEMEASAKGVVAV